jgi:tetratricopeptide (TPR) repeat protein
VSAQPAALSRVMPSCGRRSMRRRVAALGALAAACALISFAPTLPPAVHDPASPPTLSAHAGTQRAREVRERFDQAVVMLHAKRHEEAVVALQRVLALAPHLPEAHVNLGYAWLGLNQPQHAQRAFETALGIRAEQANAYYGLAMALEQRGDLEAALGAMRSYLHLSRADDAHRTRARAALWEWEERLGRHPLNGAPSAPHAVAR